MSKFNNIKKKEFCYVYKDGRYLKTSYMGDGEYELYLVEILDKDCLFNEDWSLSEILSFADGVYDLNNDYICDGSELEVSDFTQEEIELKKK